MWASGSRPAGSVFPAFGAEDWVPHRLGAEPLLPASSRPTPCREVWAQRSSALCHRVGRSHPLWLRPAGNGVRPWVDRCYQEGSMEVDGTFGRSRRGSPVPGTFLKLFERYRNVRFVVSKVFSNET